ncbi:MAG: glycosyltransferase family 9 protein [Bacteroidia bacterium]
MLYKIQQRLSSYFNKYFAEPKNAKKQLSNYINAKQQLLHLKAEIEANRNNLLVIKVDDIGDFLLFVNAFIEFLKLQPNKKIYLLLNEVCIELAKKLLPDSVSIIEFNKHNWFNKNTYKQQIAESLLIINPNKVLFPSFTRVPMLEGILQLLFDPKKIYAWKRVAERGESIEAINYLNIADNLFDLFNEPLHETEINKLFFEKYLRKDLRTNNFIDFDNDISHLKLPDKYIIICPGGNQKSKRYSANKYAQLVKILNKKFSDFAFVCIGSNNDKNAGDIILKNQTKSINLCGKTTLTELMTVCKNSTLFIGNDTGAAHMAALQNVKTIVLANGNRYMRFFPYPNLYKNVCLVYPGSFIKSKKVYNWNYKTNINEIKPFEVAAIVDEILN